MQLHQETNPALNTVTAYGHDYLEINRTRYTHAVYFSPQGNINQWDVTAAKDITTDTLRNIAGVTEQTDPMAFLDGTPARKPDDAPEVILIGTGLKQIFLPTNVIAPLLSMGIGIEVMTTQAAARTYNILMAEGRLVTAALLPQEEL